MKLSRKFSRLFVCFVWSLGLYPGWTQDQITFRQVSIKDGLSQNCGISIAQDSTGYLWIATQDGLNRYDGTAFIKYPYLFSDITRPSYSYLGNVYTDRAGGVWTIPVSRELYRFLPDDNRFEPLPGYRDASTIHQDPRGRYWVGTYTQGLHYFDIHEEKVQAEGKVALPHTVYDIRASDGLILAATAGGVFEIQSASGELLDSLSTTQNGVPVKSGVSRIAISSDGRQWFGTFGSGLFYRNPGEKALSPANALPYGKGLPADLNILSLFADSRDRIWVGTYGQGLFLLEPEKGEFSQFKADKHNPRAIHYNDILDIYEDYTGTLWFGTDGAGLSYYDEYLEKFNSIVNSQVPDEIHVDVVRAIDKDADGYLWIGTSGKGLMRYNPQSGTWKKYATNTGYPALKSDRIMSLLTDSEGLWVGTQGGGLSLLKKDGAWLHFNSLEGYGLKAITIWDIHRDQKGRTWLATREYGLLEFNLSEGVISSYNAKASPEMPVFENVRAIAEDASGNLWLGGDSEGLILLNPERGLYREFRSGPSKDSLPSDKIKSLYPAPDGTLWIGTNGSGLAALEPETGVFHTYSTENGLANNVIYAVLPDDSGHLWLSSNRGISRFTPPSNWDEAPEIVNYTNYEGLATEFNTGAAYKHEDGSMYFGGLEGFYWFSPESIENNPHLPKTAITSVRLADESLPLKSGLELDYRANTLSFTFSAMQFSLPKEIEYQYRLLNYDEGWVFAGNTPFARYSFLPPGDYEFQVQASNYDGLWNRKPATFGFTIAPPWYASSHAKVIYFLLLGVLAIGIYLYLRWRWQMKLNLKLKEAETQRLQKLNAFKSRLYTDISHEIRTPLSLIVAPVESKLKEGGLDKSERSVYSLINRNTKRIIALVDQMLHLARLEKGKLNLKPEAGNASLFLRVLARAFEYPAKEAGIEFKWDVKKTGMVWFDSDILDKIVSNLLSNAVKYCPRGGRCRFNSSYRDGKLSIDVANTLSNPESIQPERLFSRFYQGDEASEGSGIGLALVKELVRLSDGRVESKIAEGQIHFLVTLPMPGEPSKQRAPKEASKVGEPGTTSKAETTSPSDAPIILIAEDHDELREYLKNAWEGIYRVYTCDNGSEALGMALKLVPDLILSDIRMPGIDGIELCNRIKMDERSSHIPVILFTSGAVIEQELEGLEAGADDYVTKPFQLAVLEKRIDNLIQTRRDLQKRYAKQMVLEARDIAVTPADEVFLNKVQSVMDKHLNDSGFNASSFAREVGMSRMQLHRKLQTYTGLSTTAFIRSQRLKQASELLQKADLAVAEVAYAVGFNTPSYFIKCFRETYGSTPSEYTGNPPYPTQK